MPPAFFFPSSISMFTGLLDLIAEPLYVGSVCLGMSLLLAGIAGRTSKKYDFAADTRWPAKIGTMIRKPNWIFVVLLVGAGIFAVFGNVLIRRAGTRKGAEKEDRAQETLREILAIIKRPPSSVNAANPPSDSNGKAGESPEDPYEEWAQEFWKNRGDIVVRDIDLSKLSAAEFGTAMSLRWWSVLESARNTIEKAVAKYNERAPTKAVVKLQQLPRNFGNTYGVDLGTVEFASGLLWEIQVRRSGTPGIERGPVLDIAIPRGRPGAKESAGGLYIHFFNSGEFEFRNYVYGLARNPTIEDKRYSMDKFDDVFRNAILELIKAQALLLDAAGPE